MSHDHATQVETSNSSRSISPLSAIVVATVVALSIGHALAQSQNDQSQSGQGPKSEDQKQNEPDAGLRMGPMSRPPTMTRPMMQQHQTSRPTMRTPKRRIVNKPAERKGTSRATERKGASKPQQKQEQKPVTKPASTEKPVDKPLSKPAAVDQPVNRPATQIDRPQGFVNKPDSVAHNPLHNDGQLGKGNDHKPQTIEKYGQYYKRDYYSATVDGRPIWYWYDTPLGVVPPVTNNIPVCIGDTDDCPVPPPVILTDDKPKVGDDPKPKPDDKKPEGGMSVVEKECPGGTRVAGHAFSVCVGGTWHVQSFDTFLCPPNAYKRFKTLDIDTQQPCTQPPVTEPGGLMFPSTPEGVPCGNKPDDPKGGTITLIACVNGKVTERHYKRAICANGMSAPGTFIDEVTTDKDCTGGADWKPQLPTEHDGNKIEDQKEKPDAKP